jgi:hypothetical protein
MVMSSEGAWPVSSFSFESKRMRPFAERSTKPKLLAGVVIQPCTIEVTSKVM